MAADEYFQTVNPDPTMPPVQLEKNKYELMRAIILGNLREYGPMNFRELADLIREQVHDEFGASAMLYFSTVKLDLAARGEIRRVPKFLSNLIELNPNPITLGREVLCMQ
ncbi:MAG: hypothetical protein K8S20_10610 [Chloroflexi bacterium]|nr:hypothetical protein [Chloroflexota bacterium]